MMSGLRMEPSYISQIPVRPCSPTMMPLSPVKITTVLSANPRRSNSAVIRPTWVSTPVISRYMPFIIR